LRDTSLPAAHFSSQLSATQLEEEDRGIGLYKYTEQRGNQMALNKPSDCNIYGNYQ